MGCNRRDRGFDPAPAPVATLLSSSPPPVTYTIMVLPTFAGLSEALMELSWFCATARFVPYWKIPGADWSIVADFAARLATPPKVTTTAGKGKAGSNIVTSYGIWALICVGLTKTSGAGFPFTVTEVPASVIGNGTLEALPVVEARFVPKMLNSSPGASTVE